MKTKVQSLLWRLLAVSLVANVGLGLFGPAPASASAMTYEVCSMTGTCEIPGSAQFTCTSWIEGSCPENITDCWREWCTPD